MAIKRQANFLGQQRIDVPHLRAVESAVAADFDLLAGLTMAGSRALVVKGLDLVTTGAVGSLATSLQLNVGDSIVFHPNGSESGTIFSVIEGAAAEPLNSTNANVVGSFTPSQVNYIGLDLRRTADDTTADLVQFLDANTSLETPRTVPLARTLSYRIVIGTVDFSSDPTILPIAKVVTDASNAVTSIEDARQMMFRLGSGGSLPDKQYSFVWGQNRHEATNDAAGAVFEGGDKFIGSMKDFFDAVMTRLWELGGGEYWYSPTSDRDVRLVLGQPVLVANSHNFFFDAPPGTEKISWRSLSVIFANSTATYNTIADNVAGVVLPDGYCIYVDVDRSTNAAVLTVPAPVPMSSLGAPTIPGSRFVIAWRRGDYVYTRTEPYETGREYKAATYLNGTSSLGVVRLSTEVSTGNEYAGNSSDAVPVVVSLTANGEAKITGRANNVNAITCTGHGTGSGIRATGGSTSGHGGFFSGGGVSGFGVLAYGATNTGDNTAYVVSNTSHSAGAATGAVIWGGSNTHGGDGLFVAARGTGTTLRHGIIAAGLNPKLVNTPNGNGGDGGRFFGGPSTDGVAAILSEAGYCYIAQGASTTTGGQGLEVHGGRGSLLGGNGIKARGGAGLIAGASGGDAIQGYAGSGVAQILGAGNGGDGGYGLYLVAGNAANGDAPGTAGVGAEISGGNGASPLNAANAASDGGNALTCYGGDGGNQGVGTAPGNGGNGIFAQGGPKGTGAGGSPIAGYGGYFVGGAASGIGVRADGTGTGSGIVAASGVTSGYGLEASGVTGAIKIGTGEIKCSPVKIRHLIMGGARLQSPDQSGEFEGQYDRWGSPLATGAQFVLAFNVPLPVGSVITAVEIIAGNNEVADDKVAVLSLYQSFGNGAADLELLDGSTGHGEVTVTAGTAKLAISTGALLASPVIADNTWIHGFISVQSVTAGKHVYIYGVRFTYTQSQISHTV